MSIEHESADNGGVFDASLDEVKDAREHIRTHPSPLRQRIEDMVALYTDPDFLASELEALVTEYAREQLRQILTDAEGNEAAGYKVSRGWFVKRINDELESSVEGEQL